MDEELRVPLEDALIRLADRYNGLIAYPRTYGEEIAAKARLDDELHPQYSIAAYRAVTKSNSINSLNFAVNCISHEQQIVAECETDLPFFMRNIRSKYNSLTAEYSLSSAISSEVLDGKFLPHATSLVQEGKYLGQILSIHPISFIVIPDSPTSEGNYVSIDYSPSEIRERLGKSPRTEVVIKALHSLDGKPYDQEKLVDTVELILTTGRERRSGIGYRERFRMMMERLSHPSPSLAPQPIPASNCSS